METVHRDSANNVHFIASEMLDVSRVVCAGGTCPGHLNSSLKYLNSDDIHVNAFSYGRS